MKKDNDINIYIYGMSDFKKELQKAADIEFAKLKSKYAGKVDRKNTISSVSNNLTVYEKVITELSEKLEKMANAKYPEIGVSDNELKKIFKDVLESYLPQINKLTRM